MGYPSGKMIRSFAQRANHLVGSGYLGMISQSKFSSSQYTPSYTEKYSAIIRISSRILLSRFSETRSLRCMLFFLSAFDSRWGIDKDASFIDRHRTPPGNKKIPVRVYAD